MEPARTRPSGAFLAAMYGALIGTIYALLFVPANSLDYGSLVWAGISACLLVAMVLRMRRPGVAILAATCGIGAIAIGLGLLAPDDCGSGDVMLLCAPDVQPSAIAFTGILFVIVPASAAWLIRVSRGPRTDASELLTTPR